MSKEEESRDEFFEYLMALNSVWLDEETVLSDGFVEDLSERLGLTRLRKNNEDLNEKTRLIYEETKSLNERMDYLDRGLNLSEEKMKEAVRDGVKEALKDLLKELKSQDTRGF